MYICVVVLLKPSAMLLCILSDSINPCTKLYGKHAHLIYIYILHYHHTVQVARVQVQYLRQWMNEKAPPAQVAEGDATTCASGLSALVAE